MRFLTAYTVATLVSLATETLAANNPNNTRLWYTTPATVWTEALPIGNGFVGAMIFGKPDNERMQVNEDSVYSGGFRSRVNQDALEVLPDVRKRLASGDLPGAERWAKIGLTATPQSIRHYEKLGEMEIEFVGTKNYKKETYQRWLDLETAIAGVNFTVGSTTYQRDMFSSFPDNVLVHRMTVSGGSQKLAFNTRVHRPFGGGNSASDLGYNLGGDTVYMVGGTQSNDPISFATGLKILTDGTVRAVGETLVVDNATEAVALFAAATSYRHDDPVAAVDNFLNKAAERDYEDLRDRHVKDYQKLFNTFTIDIGGEGTSGSDLPTNKRINATQAGANDPGLVALQAQYGRYMLIGSSREGSLPANLQGIWCEDFESAWGSKYTVNINLEMNYWPAEVTGLSSLHHQLFDLMDLMHKTGKVTAKEMYGAGGWMSHHNTDLWGDTAPEDRYLPASYWTLSSAWLSTHLIEHYWYTGDKEFLKSKIEILSDAIQFYLDTLQEYKLDGVTYLVTSPSVSPENTYKLPDGTSTSMTIGPACDFQILTELFVGFINAVKTLEDSPVEASFIDDIEATLARFPPQRISKRYPGVFQEWIEDFQEASPGHRHISHLFALHPGSQIPPPDAPNHNKTVWDAARKTLDYRLQNGGAGTGWSRAWTINWFARFKDSKAFGDNIFQFFKSSVYPNLFDAHPPFQADGNWGFTAGVAEALIQSHVRDDDGVWHVWLLPTLPEKWTSGKVTGLVARGGFVFDITWKDGRLSSFKMKSNLGGDVEIIYGTDDASGRLDSQNSRLSSLDAEDEENQVRLETDEGEEYEFDVHWEE